jgi:hypothetical protein
MLNYEITRVRCDAQRHFIEHFELREVNSRIRSEENRWTVITRMGTGSRFRTAPPTGSGADVLAVNVGGTTYLKAVSDGIRGDNLGALPTF